MDREVATEAGAGLKALGTRSMPAAQRLEKAGTNSALAAARGEQTPSAARMRTIFWTFNPRKRMKINGFCFKSLSQVLCYSSHRSKHTPAPGLSPQALWGSPLSQ